MTNSAQIRVFSVDDHPLLHESLAMVVGHQPDMVMVAEATRGQEAIDRFREYMPDVTLMDLRLPDMSGIEATLGIRSRFPEARIIILTTFANGKEIHRALKAGARAYLFKTTPPREIVEVIRQVHAGEYQIPPEIAAHIADENVTEPSSEDANSSGISSLPFDTRLQWLSRLFRQK